MPLVAPFLPLEMAYPTLDAAQAMQYQAQREVGLME
jgi:hypothetical protein